MFDCREIVPGVVRMLMSRSFFGKDLYPAACYAIPEANLLIDSGTSRFAGQVLEAARRIEARTILLTHSHEDHAGGASLVSDALGARCHAHHEAIPVLADPRRLRMPPYRRFLFGTPRRVPASPLEEKYDLCGFRLRVLPAPGHSWDHVAFFEETRGWLFGGDAYLTVRERVLMGQGCDLPVWAQTLRDLANLGASVMFTGMGPAVRQPGRLLKEKASRFEDIIGKVRQMRQRGLCDRQIARTLFPGDLAIRLVTSGEYSAANIIHACPGGPSPP